MKPIPSLLLLLVIQLACVKICASWSISQRHSFRPSKPSSLVGMSATAAASVPVDESQKEQQQQLRTLYNTSASNSSEAYHKGTLQVDSLHTLYYELYGQQVNSHEGNKHGNNIPTALFLHGGPGAGCAPNHARFFDPERYRVVLLDQRGSGKSTPRAETRNNTLLHLVNDIELLRKELNVSKFDVVLGGSWGTTLALAYAQTYPQAVGAIILRGVCTLRRAEVDWLFAANGGIAQRNPEAWKAFQEAVNVTDQQSQDNPRAALEAYCRVFLGSNATARQTVARSWMGFEIMASISHTLEGFKPTSNFSEAINISRSYDSTTAPLAVHGSNAEWALLDPLTEAPSDKYSMPMSEMIDGMCQGIGRDGTDGTVTTSTTGNNPLYVVTEEAEGAMNQNRSNLPAQNMLTCFYSTNVDYAMDGFHLLDQTCVDRIRHIPCITIQGGKDRITPIDTAIQLKESWPELELRIPLKAGHSMYDAAVTHEIVKATDRFAAKLA